MVNVAGRSKGCASCRRRKVKCDETFPQCQKCTARGLRCPGPRTGAFFVHVHSGETPAADENKAPTAFSPNQLTNAFVHIPLISDVKSCRATAFDQLFVSHFVESFGQLNGVRFPVPPNANWLERLPQFVSSPANSLTKTSIRSASMLSYGTWASDKSIQTEAYRWYEKALLGLQVALSQSARSASEATVCSAVMLIHFETWAATVEGAWVKHINGASTLMEAIGPQACRDGFMHSIFCHLRFQTFMASMHDNNLSAFSTAEWVSVPFEIRPQNVFDQIVTILFDVQECLFLAKQIIQSSEEDSKAYLELQLKGSTQTTISKLIIWEKQFMPVFCHRDTSDPGEDTSTSSTSSSDPTTKPHDLVPSFRFASMPEAALFSLYHAAALVIYQLLVITQDGAELDVEHLNIHTSEILRAYKYVRKVTNKAPTSNLGPIMMVPQLKLAAMWSAGEKDRMMARRMLIRIGQHQSFALGSIWDMPDAYFANVAQYVGTLVR